MNQQALLKKTVALAKTGDKEAFENFYILTVQETYTKITSAVRNKKEADELLVDTYVMLYRHAHELPLEEEALNERINDEICRITYKKLGIEIQGFPCEDEYNRLSEDNAATLWLCVEVKAGFNKTEQEDEKNFNSSFAYSLGKIVVTIFVLLITIISLYMGVRWFRGKGDSQKTGSNAIEMQETHTDSLSKEIIIEKERLQPGWELRPDGKLYYVKHDGILADGAIAIGKQIITCSGQGELSMMENNPMVSENPNLSFDENVRYEVKSGDIYKKDLSTENAETVVVMNGHVVQMDVRCGFIWYICKYRVPNSEQVNTTIYRSDLNGEKQEELYSTENTLNMEQFQMTSEWMYYISDGTLLRKNLKTESVESLAKDVEHYFAWENTAYYMKDRTLEHVSQGIDYSGIEAGYKIELGRDGFVLLDASGSKAEPDANGEKQVGDRVYTIDSGVISAVHPAIRTEQDVTYYIDSAGRSRKLYSKNASGAQSLVRQDGLTVDSFCIAGEALYYSARTVESQGEVGSQIYRLNLRTMESEEVGDAFRGYINNLYYFEGIGKIIGEYVLSAADPENIHGQLMMLSIGGKPQIIDDTGVRPSSEGSDALEVVMANGSQIDCLYHTCNYNSETGQMEWTSSQPLVIQLNMTEN
ncbi:MAG: hypothetical protein RSG54_02540 [Clostridium sp.]